jgi:ornithine cyclodeaminase/alanine dehydrogenase-like protein (mu-crystallin family)
VTTRVHLVGEGVMAAATALDALAEVSGDGIVVRGVQREADEDLAAELQRRRAQLAPGKEPK